MWALTDDIPNRYLGVQKTKHSTFDDDRNTHRKLSDLLVPAGLPKATALIPLD